MVKLNPYIEWTWFFLKKCSIFWAKPADQKSYLWFVKKIGKIPKPLHNRHSFLWKKYQFFFVGTTGRSRSHLRFVKNLKFRKIKKNHDSEKIFSQTKKWQRYFFARNLNLGKPKLCRSPFSKEKSQVQHEVLKFFLGKNYHLFRTMIENFSKSIIIKFDNFKYFDYQKYCFLFIYAILKLQYWSEVIIHTKDFTYLSNFSSVFQYL